jgi:hypothetical protein
LRAAQIAQKNNGNSNNDYNDNNNQEQVSDEKYLADQQEERFTDDNAHSEHFKDDYNEADRFTS